MRVYFVWNYQNCTLVWLVTHSIVQYWYCNGLNNIVLLRSWYTKEHCQWSSLLWNTWYHYLDLSTSWKKIYNSPELTNMRWVRMTLPNADMFVKQHSMKCFLVLWYYASYSCSPSLWLKLHDNYRFSKNRLFAWSLKITGRTMRIISTRMNRYI